MAGGVRDLANNIALRKILRREYTPFDRPPPAPDPTFADEDLAVAAARLKNARIIDAALASALLTADVSAIQIAEQGRTGRPPQGTGNFLSLAGATTTGLGFDSSSFGPFAFPFRIHEITITATNQAAAGTRGAVEVSVFLTGADESGNTGGVPVGTRIWPDDFFKFAGPITIEVVGQDSNHATYRASKIVAPSAQFLTIHFRTIAGGTIEASAVLLIEELTYTGGLTAAPPESFLALNRSVGGSVPPAPRTPGRPRPVGFTFQVTQGGRTLFTRTVPYSSAAAIEAGYNPITGAARQNVTVHTSEQSWSDAFQNEQNRRT